MLKKLWKSVEELKTPERRLLFGLMLTIIVVLWLSLKDRNSENQKRIVELEAQVDAKDRAKETQRILLQDKVDNCQEDKIKMLQDFYQQTERMKAIVKDIK